MTFKMDRKTGSRQNQGVTMGVSKGTWSNAPVAYAYRWEDCNASGGECVTIPGATNSNYTLTWSDLGHTVIAQVTATNGGGSVVASTQASRLLRGQIEYSHDFGSEGTGNGQFRRAYDVAADSKGHVWVADYSNQRVEEFNEKGEYLSQFGVLGKGSGQFEYPIGIATDAEGNVWVVDTENRRIEEFNEKGGFIKQFGTKGTGVGEFGFALGIAVDKKGNVWVTDNTRNIVDEFNHEGKYLKQLGGPGAGNGQLSGPDAVAVDGEGHVWVADTYNDRVEEFSEEGQYLKQFGEKGTGPGQFEEAAGIAIDPKGDVWVTDRKNDRVEEFGNKGEFLTAIGSKGSGSGQFEGPFGVATDANDDLWVMDQDNSRVDEWSPLPPSQGEPQVEYSHDFGSEGTGSGQFRRAYDVAADSKGHVWVADYSNQRIEEFNESGEYLRQVGSLGKGNGQFEYPIGITTDAEGNVWVVDTENRRIEEFNENGGFIKQFGTKGTGVGEFGFAIGIAVDKKGNVWVTDKTRNIVDEFNHEGKYLKQLGGPGAGNGQLSSPEAVAVDGEGHVWVADTWNNRVQEFSEEGQYLRQFGEKGTGPGQFEEAAGIAIDPKGNVWVTDRKNDRVEEFSNKGEYLTAIGVKGKGNGQFEEPFGVAADAKGDLWVLDQDNARVEEWSPPPIVEGEKYGPGPGTTIEYHVPLSGTGVPLMTESAVTQWAQKDDPVEATAIIPPDEPMGWPATDYKRATIYYMDSAARTVNVGAPSGGISTSEYNEDNEIIRTLSADSRAAALKEGSKSAEASKLLDTKDTYNESGEESGTQLLETLGPQHTVKLSSGKEVQARNHVKDFYDEEAPKGPEAETYDLVTKSIDGAEYEGKEADTRETKTSYSGQDNLGWKLRKATSVTTDPSGLNQTHTTVYSETSGNVIETETSAGSGRGSASPTYTTSFTHTEGGEVKLGEPNGVAVDPKTGNVWVADNVHDDVVEFNSEHAFLGEFGTKGAGEGQFNGIGAVATDALGDVYVTDTGNDRVQEFSSSGVYRGAFGSPGTGEGQFHDPSGIAIDSSGNVWVLDSGNDRVEEFSTSSATFGKLLSHFGSDGTGRGELQAPTGLAVSGGYLYVAEQGNRRVQEFSTAGKSEGVFDEEGSGSGQSALPDGIAADPKTGDLYVTDREHDNVQEFSPTGSFMLSFGSGYGPGFSQNLVLPAGGESGRSAGPGNGEFTGPTGVAVDASGVVYVVDTGNKRVEEWASATGNPQAHDSKTVYYASEATPEHPACGGHPEWANLPCETQSAAQPGTPGLPNVPVVLTTYNVWDEPEATTETFGSTTRTKRQSYDAAGRETSSEISSSTDTLVPTVTDAYNEKTGALETQSTTSEGKTKTITSMYNSLGQLTEYTDADGSKSRYVYDIDGRVEEMSFEIGKERFSQIYSYDSTTGYLTNLLDSSAKMFTATYDVEGKITSEGYPNGMSANSTYNAVGEKTNLEYVKTAHCVEGSEKCTWFKDASVPSIHGEALSQTSTLAHEEYTYDALGRLTEAQETPAGKGCTARLYTYDEESDRTSLTTRASASEQCPPEGGTTETHSYDTADRLTDSGVRYETFGNITQLPAADAGGAELLSSYYVDNQVASQTQSGETVNYFYDPVGRTRERASTGKTSSTVVSHYSGPGEALTWTSEGSEKWTRNIPGIDGGLDAIQKSGEAPVLKLHDLQGNVVGETGLAEGEVKLLSPYNSTEFGVPAQGTTPPEYAWLGAAGIASELSSGAIAQDGVTYVPQLGKPLQTQGVALPIPVNAATPFISTIEPWVAGVAAESAARQVAAAEAARRALEGSTCDEEVEGCGPDPEHGANPWGCRVWVSWGKGLHLNEYLAVHGHWSCEIAPAHIEVQIALLEVVNGKYKRVDFAKTTWNYPGEGVGKTGSEFSKGYECNANQWYQAWVWGRTWDAWTKETTWYATAEDGHWDQCPEGVEDPTEGPPDIK